LINIGQLAFHCEKEYVASAHIQHGPLTAFRNHRTNYKRNIDSRFPPPTFFQPPSHFPHPSQAARPSAKMKLSLYQVICIYFVLQANALLKEPKKDPKDILPSDFEQYEFETVTPIELEIETSSSSSSSLPAETSRPDGLAPVYGQMSPGKPIWQCWYEKLPFRNRFHITAVNWNMSEGDVKSACKKSDAMTFWDWKEHRNAANAQSFTAEVRFLSNLFLSGHSYKPISVPTG
jgi:hypothetical protein